MMPKKPFWLGFDVSLIAVACLLLILVIAYSCGDASRRRDEYKNHVGKVEDALETLARRVDDLESFYLIPPYEIKDINGIPTVFPRKLCTGKDESL